MTTGVVVVDKPSGITSHGVVSRIRRLAGTRKVGHAGTLDPMATGVLVLGIGRATRLLGHITASDKGYDATIRLGASTVTDDVEGEVTSTADASGVADDAIRAAVRALTGPIEQVPSAVSAVKIDGVRSFHRVRKGEEFELPARAVTVHRFDVGAIRRAANTVDVDVHVECSAGTYVRALARDLGAALGVGGHLTALRRTRAGVFTVADAHTLEELTQNFTMLSIEDAAAAVFPRLDVDAETARLVGHGVPLPALDDTGPVAVFGPDGRLLSLTENRGGKARHLAVFVG